MIGLSQRTNNELQTAHLGHLGWRRVVALAIGTLMVAGGIVLAPGVAASQEEQPPEPPSGGGIAEVAQLPVLSPDYKNATATKAPRNGFLVLNPVTRRAYQFFEDGPPNKLEIQSFDLDTLEPLRRETLTGVLLIPAGNQPAGAGIHFGGELIHAVDHEGGRIFLPLAKSQATEPISVGSMDAARKLEKVVVIDERAFDTGSENFATDLARPADHAALLATHALRGMTFARGKLLAVFADYSPVVLSNVPSAPIHRPVYNHYLSQWDPDGSDHWLHLLASCQRAPLNSAGIGESVYQLGILRTESAMHLGCQAAIQVAQAVTVHLANERPKLNEANAPTEEAVILPKVHADVLVDEASERLYFSSPLRGLTWWVFDTKKRSFASALSLAPGYAAASAGIDPQTGRFYALVPNYTFVSNNEHVAGQGGLMYTDSRLPVVPQALNVAPELAYPATFRIVTDPVTQRVFVRRGKYGANTQVAFPSTEETIETPPEPFYRVFKDTIPVTPPPDLGDLDRLTTDVDEVEGITDANYSATGSGFGMRVRLTGGISAATRREINDAKSQCTKDDRELVLGEVQSAQLSNAIVEATAVAFAPDRITKEDALQPSGRCWPKEFPEPLKGPLEKPPAGSGAAVDGGLVSLAGNPWDAEGPDGKPDGLDDFTSSCAGDGEGSASPKRTGRHYRSSAKCHPDVPGVEAVALASFAPVADGAEPLVQVASATSKVSIERDPEKGVVTTVDSMARGITIAGIGTIGVIRTEAKTFAAGRPGTAKTEFVRTICGVELFEDDKRIARCLRSDVASEKAQQDQIVGALNSALGRNGTARMREPEPTGSAGTPGGYQSSIRRDEAQAFNDETLSRDDSKAVPGLEIIFYRDDNLDGSGRQIFHFAGVEASSSYGIYCINGPAQPLETNTDTDTLEIDADTATLETDVDTDTGGSESGSTGCALPPQPDPSRLTILLNDDAGEPLEGGVFEVHVDSDTDGVLGPDDEVIEDGSCITGDDGTGDCVFDDLPPGAYVIEQTSAPPGYAKAPVFAHFVDPAMDYTVTFTNLKSVAGVQIGLTDDSTEAKPLAGGVFELFADDGDEILGDADVLYASCTTDATGTCELDVKLDVPAVADAGSVVDVVGDLVDAVCQPLEDATGCVLDVPLGSYVVHQAAAPQGFATADDVGFTFDQPGQMASLAFVNGLAGSDVVVEATPGTPEIPPTPPTEVLVWDEGTGTPRPIVESSPLEPPAPSLSNRASDALTQVLSVPLEAFRFLFNNPREVALMAAVWALLFLPCYLGERRRVLDRLRTHIAPSEAA